MAMVALCTLAWPCSRQFPAELPVILSLPFAHAVFMREKPEIRESPIHGKHSAFMTAGKRKYEM